MNSKEKAIELAYVKLIGQEKFNELKAFIDENGYTELDEELFGFEFCDAEIEYFDFDSSNKWRSKTLSGIENNRGWTAILSEKDLPSDLDKVHFVLKGFEEYDYSGYYNNGLFWNLNEAYAKEIVSHFQPVEKKPKPIY